MFSGAEVDDADDYDAGCVWSVGAYDRGGESEVAYLTDAVYEVVEGG